MGANTGKELSERGTFRGDRLVEGGDDWGKKSTDVKGKKTKRRAKKKRMREDREVSLFGHWFT